MGYKYKCYICEQRVEKWQKYCKECKKDTEEFQEIYWSSPEKSTNIQIKKKTYIKIIKNIYISKIT